MSGIKETGFGKIGDRQITRYTLINSSGMEVSVINYGGVITSIIVPDKTGAMEDVALGFDSLSDYELPTNPHFGGITGRFANRIANGKFELDGKTYQLSINNDGNTLHGGKSGFIRKIWEPVALPGGRLKLTYISKDGEEGFPGNCSVEVIYSLTNENELTIEYSATADKATPFNITNHSYFNLSPGGDTTVLEHEIKINADRYVPVNDKFIPTGKLAPVKDTAMDFKNFSRIGTHVHEIAGGGYDHNYVLNKTSSGKPELAATVHHAGSGRILEMFTTEPGMQFYSGNFLNGTLTGKRGVVYVQHAGLCLEAQHFPDSPNQPDFPDTILRPGETYKQTTIYKFSVK